MNSGLALGFFWFFLIVILYSFYLSKKKSATERFRLLVSISGSSLALGAALNWLRAFENYSGWFLPNVYPALEWIFTILVATGVVTLFLALVSESRNGSGKQVDDEQDKSSGDSTGISGASSGQIAHLPAPARRAALNLRRELERPLNVIDLGTLALNRLLGRLDLNRGALFVFSESNARLALISAAGLSLQQQAGLERLDADNPLVSDALASGALSLAALDSQNEAGGALALALPLISQSETMGIALLYCETALAPDAEARAELEELASVIADNLLVARLRGQLHRQKTAATRRELDQKLYTERIERIHASFFHPDCHTALSTALVGVGGADAVGLFAYDVRTEHLALSGFSDGFPVLSAGFKRAIAQGVVRDIPVLLNQRRNETARESAVDSARRVVGLVYPLHDSAIGARRLAMVFLSREGEFKLNTEEFSSLRKLMSGACQGLGAHERQSKNERQRQTLRAVYQLLKKPPIGDARAQLEQFFRTLSSYLPERSVALLFENGPGGRLRPIESHGVAFGLVADLVILPGEGTLGRAAALGCESLEIGRERLEELADEYDMLNRDLFGRGFSAFGNCAAELILPLAADVKADYALAVYLPDHEPALEIMHSLGLVTHAQSLALSVAALREEQSALREGHGRRRDLGLLINSLNNDLAAIVGNCQLAQRDPNLSGAQERALKVIRECAEHSSATLRSDTIHFASTDTALSQSEPLSTVPGVVSLTETMKKFAENYFVGGQILLAEGNAREVTFDLRDDFLTTLDESDADSLIKALTSRFVSLADESEVVTISAFHDGAYQYLTFSRQRRHFPPLTEVGRLGAFTAPGAGMFCIPDTLASAMRLNGFEIALDDDRERPAYLSLRAAAPTRRDPELEETTASSDSEAPRILAIDDQSMILELLSAMCETLGYAIDTFESPTEALEAFENIGYDIVITDVAMPELSGWDVARRIRETNAETYLIFITGWREGLKDDDLDALGVDQVLHKPFRLEQLSEALEKACSAQLSP